MSEQEHEAAVGAEAGAAATPAEPADSALPEAAVGQPEAPASAGTDEAPHDAAPVDSHGAEVAVDDVDSRAEPADDLAASDTSVAEERGRVSDVDTEPDIARAGDVAITAVEDDPPAEGEGETPLTGDASLDGLGRGLAAEAGERPRLARSELKAILEALIFASPEPLTPKQMFKLLDTEPKEDIQEAVTELKQDYERPGGLQLVEIAGGYQIVTRSDLHDWVRRLFHERTTQKLSVQALETLAVIAYRQPVTALEIAEIRGVNTSGVLNTLLERHLIKIVGRKQVVGRPFMYGTTKEFLIRFGLNALGDLPKVQDMAEALGFETPAGLVEQNPPEEMLPLDEPDEDNLDALDESSTDEDPGDNS